MNVSRRGLPLLFQGTPSEGSVLTAENYCKWYGLYLVHSSGVIEDVGFPADEDAPDESAYCDHVPNPRAVVRMAERLGAYLDENTLDMIVGRWFREVKGYV